MTNQPKTEYTPQLLLERWGLRTVGTSLKGPIQPALSKGDPGVDVDLAIMIYVESVPGYKIAKPVLYHVYAEGKSIYDFRLLEPGETIFQAVVLRLEWGRELLKADAWGKEGESPDPWELPRLILKNFRDALADKVREHPFCEPVASQEPCSAEVAHAIAADVSAEVDERHARNTPKIA
ncbi:MAG TPA: hypothetical protein VG944_14635 [Fimbriimonas sp.]|nr:hypothetical protein [Fimbriimonas sp.]